MFNREVRYLSESSKTLKGTVPLYILMFDVGRGRKVKADFLKNGWSNCTCVLYLAKHI